MQTERRKVLFLMDCLYGDAGGGSERQFLRLYQECDLIGVDPYVVFLRDEPIHQTIDWRRPPIVLGLRSLGSPVLLRALWCLKKFVTRERIDVVHSWFDDAALLAALLRRLLPRVTFIASQRNIGYAHRWPRSRLLGAALRTADRVAVNAGVVRDHVIRTHGVPRECVRVIANIHSPEIRPSEDADRIIATIRVRHEFVVLVVANLRPIKGIDDLVEAATLTRDDARIGYVVIGAGEDLPRYQDQIVTRGLTERVYLLGPRQDVRAFIARADIGVLPSRSEGLSNALVEYMFGNLPIVATAVGGNPEALDDGASGRLVPPGEPKALAHAILELANDRDGARRLGQAAGDSARRRYDRDLVLESFRRLYSERVDAGVR